MAPASSNTSLLKASSGFSFSSIPPPGNLYSFLLLSLNIAILPARLVWETPENALKVITESYDKLVASKYESVYHTRFIALRDRKILLRFLLAQIHV